MYEAKQTLNITSIAYVNDASRSNKKEERRKKYAARFLSKDSIGRDGNDST